MYGCCSLTLCVLGQVPPGREADFQFSSQEGLNVSMREAALSREARSPQYATLCHTVLCCDVRRRSQRRPPAGGCWPCKCAEPVCMCRIASDDGRGSGVGMDGVCVHQVLQPAACVRAHGGAAGRAVAHRHVCAAQCGAVYYLLECA